MLGPLFMVLVLHCVELFPIQEANQSRKGSLRTGPTTADPMDPFSDANQYVKDN
jgi:hypothetical protein